MQKMRALKAGIFVSLVCFVSSSTAPAQIRRLKVDNIISVPSLSAAAIVSPIKCDPDGNIVFRTIGGSDPDDFPLNVVSQDGQKLASYHVSDLAMGKESRIVDYAHDRNTLYILLKEGGESWISRYGDDGTLRNSVPLGRGIDAFQVEVTRSGDLFVAGTDAKPRKTGSRAVFAIYSTAGQQMRLIEPAKDINPPTTDSGRREFERAVSGSLAVVGPDGNLYLMRFAPKGPVFVITPSGTTKRIPLNPPDGAANSATLAAASGRFAVQFLKFKPSTTSHQIETAVIHIIDTYSGEVRTAVEHNSGTGLACYDGETLVFVGTDESSHIKVVKMRPE